MSAVLLSLCLTLCNPVDCSLSGSSVHGILQARILKWVAISYSRGSSRSMDWTHMSYISCTGRQVLYRFIIWEDQGQGFLKYDSWTSSISITWEFVRNVSSWDFPRRNEWQTLREGPAICIFISLPLDLIHTSLKTVAVSIFQTEEMGRSIAGHWKHAPQN